MRTRAWVSGRRGGIALARYGEGGLLFSNFSGDIFRGELGILEDHGEVWAEAQAS